MPNVEQTLTLNDREVSLRGGTLRDGHTHFLEQRLYLNDLMFWHHHRNDKVYSVYLSSHRNLKPNGCDTPSPERTQSIALKPFETFMYTERLLGHVFEMTTRRQA